MKNDDLKRDKRFQKQLAKKLDVDQPPESYFRAVQNAFDNLPDELPVKRRPFHQTAWRTCVAFAACLVLVVAGIYGVYLVNPVLVESIPGVGQIFQELNQEEDSPKPTPSPNVDRSYVESQIQEEIAPFQPVSVDSMSGLGALTVENAWSDGIYLHIEMSLEAWDIDTNSFYLLNPFEDIYNSEADNSALAINGETAERMQSPDQCGFSLSSDGTSDTMRYTASWVYKLPEQEAHNTDLSVDLSIPRLYGVYTYESPYPSWDCEFYSSFSVTVDTSRTLVQDNQVEDNGITLNHVEATPTCVIAQVTAANFGWADSSLVLPLTFSDPNTEAVPLGIYSQLTTPSGEILYSPNLLISSTPNSYPSYPSLSSNGTYDLTVAFQSPTEDFHQLILTFYEYDLSFFDTLTSENSPSNRVTAEFTIDLDSKSIYPSQNYLMSGRQKLDYRISASLDRTPDPENGYICSYPYSTEDYLTLNLFTKDSEYHSLLLNVYDNEQLIGSYPSVPSSEYNTRIAESDLYQTSEYSFLQTPLDSPYLPDGYTRISFQLYNLGDANSIAGSISSRFELVDGETGNVLISDIRQTYLKEFDQVFGTQQADTLFGDSSSLNQENTSQFGENMS